MASATFAPLDALAYVDVTHPDYEAYALTQIEDEMIAMDTNPNINTTADFYLSTLTKPYTPSSTPLAAISIAAITANNGVPPTAPTTYRPVSFLKKPTTSLQNDVQAWKKAVSDAKVTIENENLTLMNLELLNEFGATAHMAHITELTRVSAATFSTLSDRKNEVDMINASRKAAQDKVAPKYGVLTRKWTELVAKNSHLEGVVKEMEKKRQKTD